MATPSPMPLTVRRPLAVAATALAVVLGAVGLAGCGGSDEDPAVTGARSQAVERLQDYGLPADQAECLADELGPDSVVEATDLNALVDSQQYRDAADACIDD